MDASHSQLQNTLTQNFQELSPQLQRAARYIMENPQDIATYSLRKVAQRSGLTPPSFSRLARAIGFKQYEDLKDICRSEIKRNSLTLAQRAAAMQENGKSGSPDTGSFAQQQLSSSIDNLTQLYQKLNVEDLVEVADNLANAKQVVLVGALSSRAVLEYLHHMMGLANPGWTAINDDHLSTSAMLAGAREDTCVIVISIRPYIGRTVQVAELAAQNNIAVISITDDIASPVLGYSDHSFLVPTESPQFFPSYVAVLTLLEILTGMLVRRWGEEANNRIDSVERLSRAIGDYI